MTATAERKNVMRVLINSDSRVPAVKNTCDKHFKPWQSTNCRNAARYSVVSAILTGALKEQIYFVPSSFWDTVRSTDVESAVQLSLSGVD